MTAYQSMNRITITPASEEHWLQLRTQDLTSTDIAALFNLSPYKTHFELWHEKKAGQIVQIQESERMKWGRRLEATVAKGIADDMGWAIRPMKEYMRVPDLRIGSSFDFRVAGEVPACDTENDYLLEIKCVDWLAFRDGWTIEEGFIEAPAHIEIQVQHQMLVSGLKRAYIGVMVGGNDIRIIERQADPEVHAGILAAARGFWNSIDANTPPDPVMPDDADAVIRMHQYAEPGRIYDGRNDAVLASLLQQYHQFGEAEKASAEQRKVLKAQILQIIGDAEKVLTPGFTVSAGLVGPSLGTLVTPEMVGTYVGGRSGYRLFRCTPKKATKKEPAE